MKKKSLIEIFVLGIFISLFIIKTSTINSFIKSNQVIESSVLSLIPHTPISITSDADFISLGLNGSGTLSDPYIIEGYNITTTKLYSIYIYHTTKHFVIRNCYLEADFKIISIVSNEIRTIKIINNTCANGEEGINISGPDILTLINNTCINNNKRGISLASPDVTLINNTCINSGMYGINLFVDKAKIVNNNCSYNNVCGIQLSSSDATFTGNICNNNKWKGLALHSSSNVTLENNTFSENRDGVFISSCTNTHFNDNICSNNEHSGIFFEHSSAILLTYNSFEKNLMYGVNISNGSNDNIIHHNNFIDNNPDGSSQAYDAGANNSWYDITTKEGNWWNDWLGRGEYLIDGPSCSSDLYPLASPVEQITKKSISSIYLIPIAILFLLIIFRKKDLRLLK